jgi:hypothetical protein
VSTERQRSECPQCREAYRAAKERLEKSCKVMALPFFTKKAMELFATIVRSGKQGHHSCLLRITADEMILATWLLANCHPRTVLFETMKRQVELWLQILQTADPGQLFSDSQRDLLLDAFVKWKSGSQFKPLDRKLRNARFYEELRRRMRPSLN